MNEQPKPLQLADTPTKDRDQEWHKDADAELRRLHEAHEWRFVIAGEQLRRIEKLEREAEVLRKEPASETISELFDRVEWLEKGNEEWREMFNQAWQRDTTAQATVRVAIRHLHAVLNKCRTCDEQQRADTTARDWLISIGSEPE